MSAARWLLLMVCGAFAFALPGIARADTTCTATTVAGLAFGNVATIGVTDTQTSFSITCSTTSLTVLGSAKVRLCLSLGAGSTGGSNYTPRQMTDAASDVLQYQIYSDAARSQIWGGVGNASAPNPVVLDFNYSVPVIGGSQTINNIILYGRVPAGQVLSAGSYSSSFTGTQVTMQYSYNEVIIGTPPTPTSCTSGGTGYKSASGAFPFTASATVPTQCHSYLTADLDFGQVGGSVASAIDRTTTFGLTCTNHTAWNIGLNNGLYASGSTRRMRQGTTGNYTYVSYEMYRDSSRSIRWGNTVGTDTLSGTGTGSAQTLTIYGRVPSPQTPPAGNYSDTVTITITY